MSQMIEIKNSSDTPEENSREPEGLKTTALRIPGLDCVDCAAKLEKQVNQFPGVDEAKINFGAGKIEIKHQAPISEILTALEKLGYPGEVDSGALLNSEVVPFWKSNQYILPTLISTIMLASALIAGQLYESTMISTSLFLAGIILGGFLPAKKGLSILIYAHELDMNLLMTIAVLGAVIIGQFEEAATVVFLFSLGNALQSFTMEKTRNSICALMDLTPKHALVRRLGVDSLLPVEEIELGDILIIRPGERIAMDGRVLQGVSSVNQAPITGEALPVDKSPGDMVYAGTINQTGALDIETTHLARDNTISRITTMVEEAQGQRAPAQQLIDRFAKHYTPLVISLAVLVAILPSLLFGQPFHKWFYEALAMLLVACPCALIISTPVSIVSAIGSAARNGVLIKGGIYLEEAGALSVVAFDKTGTLTLGKPLVSDVLPINGYALEEILAKSAAIESRSEHPLGAAIFNYARDKGVAIPAISSFSALPGYGAQGIIDDQYYQIGKPQLFADRGVTLEEIREKIDTLQNTGKTVMVLGNHNNLMGIIAVADKVRDQSRMAVESLKKAGIKKVIMLTGDNQATAQAIAAETGMDEFKADLMPEDKVVAMQELLERYQKVAMVGDGVNDAPAMAISTVGFAMGVTGTDTALETADIALMADDLTKLTYAIKLSRKTLRIIRQNISLALVIKGVILLMVVPGWLTLWLAVAGDMGCSLLVILNGMRLLQVNS